MNKGAIVGTTPKGKAVRLLITINTSNGVSPMCTTGRGLTHRRHATRCSVCHRPRMSSTPSGCRRSSCRLLRPHRRHLARRHLRFRQVRRLRLLTSCRCGSVPRCRRAYVRRCGWTVAGHHRRVAGNIGKRSQAGSRSGATVGVVARNKDALEAVAGPIGGTVSPADLGSRAGGRPHRQGRARGGPVDVLVNDAASESPAASPMPPRTSSKDHEVDYLAPAGLCRQAYRGCCGAAAATWSTSSHWPASA